MTPTLAMTGATGFVGGATMRQAVEAGWHVRALTRRPQPEREGVTWIAGAPDQPASLAAMAAGPDVVLHIPGAANLPTRQAFRARHAAPPHNILPACRTSGVTTFPPL